MELHLLRFLTAFSLASREKARQKPANFGPWKGHMDSQMKPARIEFQAASFTVAERRILSDLSVDLTAQRIGIIGRNGSGKTSFARLLSGLVEPSNGTVRIDGLDPAKDRRAALSLVGILFQNPDHQIIFPTVVEELAFGLRQLGLDDPEAAAVRN